MTKSERIAYWCLAGGVFVYLFLRALQIPLVHDETSSYWIYMRTADFIPPFAFWDASNQLLNSAFGALVHSFVTTKPFWVRLGSLISFLPFAYFLYQLANQFSFSVSRWVIILPLFLCSFFIEFFALGRGYAMAITGVIAAFYFAFKIEKNSSNKNIFGLVMSGFLGALGNLSVIVVVFILYGWVLLLLKIVCKKSWLTVFSWAGLMAMLQLPLVWFLFELKNRGNLYHGGQDVIEFTLIPFAKYFLRNESLWWLIALVYLGVITVWIAKVVPLHWKKLFQPNNLFPLVLTLAVISMFAQNIILGVNYPEDRAALVFYPLLLGAIASIPLVLFQRVMLVVLLWLPIDFFTTANLTYSRLWSHEHIPSYFAEKIESLKGEYPSTLSGYFLRYSIWNYLNLNNKPSSVVNPLDYPSTWADFVLVDTEYVSKIDTSKYIQLGYDKASAHYLLQRENLLEETLVYDSTYTQLDLSGEFLTFSELDASPFHEKGMAIYFDFEIESETDYLDVYFTTSVVDEKAEKITSIAHELSVVNEQWKSQPTWKMKMFLPALPSNSETIVLWLYNPKKGDYGFKYFKVKSVALTESNN